MIKGKDIHELVKQMEQERHETVSMMRRYEKMWTMDYWSLRDRREAMVEGRELFTSSSMRNAIILGQWLITSDVKFRSVAEGEDEGEVANQKGREIFLEALWHQQGQVFDIHPIDAIKWHLLVHGRAVLQSLWINHQIPDSQRAFVPPVSIRALNPLNVGVMRGPLGTQYAYHRYCEPVMSAVQRYPRAKSVIEGLHDKMSPKGLVHITDFWEQDGDKVHNRILVEDEVVATFKDTGYPYVPIIEELADGSPTERSDIRGNPLVGHLYDNWTTRNMLESMRLTATRDHFWPSMNVKNEAGHDIPDEIERGRGAINVFPEGTEFMEDKTAAPNATLADSLAGELEREQEQGSFPAALYGDSGQQRSALGFNGMTKAGQGRIRGYISAMGRLLGKASQCALCLVGSKADGELTLYRYNDVDDFVEPATISPQTVGERKVVHVIIDDQVASDDLQLMVGALQLFDRNIMSGQTIRDDYTPKPARKDELARIIEEEVLNDPDIRRTHIDRIWEERTGEPLVRPEQQQQLAQAQQPQAQAQSALQQPQGAQVDAVVPELQAGAATGGQITPETLGGDPRSALIEQMLLSGQVATPEEALQTLQAGG